MSETEWLLLLTVLATIALLLLGIYEAVMLWARRDRRRLDERLDHYTRSSDYWKRED